VVESELTTILDAHGISPTEQSRVVKAAKEKRLNATIRDVVHPDVDVLQLSARTGEGVDAWCQWLASHRSHAEVASEARERSGDHPGERHQREPSDLAIHVSPSASCS